MTMTLRVLALSTLLALLASGCGVQESAVVNPALAPTRGAAATRDFPCTSPQGNALGLVGLSESEAKAEATKQGYMFWVECRQGAGIPGDLANFTQRVNVTLVAGQVTAASVG
jgi:hypothetical protein